MTRQAVGARVGFVGDIGLGPAHAKFLEKHGAGFLHEEVKALFSEVDLVVGNLECSVPDFDAAGVVRSDLFARPELLRCLREQPNLHVCLANNHIADYGDKGVNSTIRQLQHAGIRYFGAGGNYAAAVEPHIVEIGEISLGFICASDFKYASATQRTAGSAPLDARRLLRQVSELKGDCTHVIVILHADEEFKDFPAPYRIRLSRRLVDAGADAVIQHHPHVVQGVENYKGNTIAYSLGNWAFNIGEYQSQYRQTRFGAFLSVELLPERPEQAKWAVTHTMIDDMHRPVLPPAALALEQQDRFQLISQRLTDKKFLRKHWFRTCRSAVKKELMTCYFIFRKTGLRTLKNRLGHVLNEPLFRRQVLGLLSLGIY